jgi:hypothetical protein
MKTKLLYLILPVIIFASGCVSNKNSNPTPVNPPLGTFTGEFKRTHTNAITGAIDSTRANIILQMETTGYKVTGDTSTLHAGSYGGFIINAAGTGIDFVDKTFPLTVTPVKIHLNGVYQYTYQGTNLQLLAYGPQDTLSFYYNLTKTGN